MKSAPFLLVLAVVSSRVAAQDTTAVDTSNAAADTSAAPPPLDLRTLTPAQQDSARLAARPVSPMGALFRSFLIPGWGQAKLDRKLTGAVFVTFEAISLGMALKASNELDYMDRTNSQRANDKRQERDDWIALLIFNHLMAGLEAFVSAHLWDFPPDLRIRPLPGGGTGAGVSLPLRIP